MFQKCLLPPSIRTMEVICTSETSINLYKSTQCNIPEDKSPSYTPPWENEFLHVFTRFLQAILSFSTIYIYERTQGGHISYLFVFHFVNYFKVIHNFTWSKVPCLKCIFVCRRMANVEKTLKQTRYNLHINIWTSNRTAIRFIVTNLHGKFPLVTPNWEWLLWFPSGMKSTYKWTIYSLQDTGSFRQHFSSSWLTQR
jgi:hypothetical protein